MPSFSNRPGYGLPQSSDYPAVPRAPRAPHFPSPTGPVQPHAYAATGPFPAQSGALSARHAMNVGGVPAAPNSLSPVAMASARSAVATGPQATMDTGPSRPSAKAGMSILFAGAIIGGLIGAVMHARQNAADAYAAAQQTHEAAPLPSGSIWVPPISASAGGSVIAPPSKDPVKDLLAKDDKKNDATSDAKGAKKGKRPVWTGGAKVAGVKVTEASAGGDEPEPPKTAKGKKPAKDDDDGYTVASANKDEAPKAEKPAAAEKPEKPSKKPAAEKETTAKADKPEKKPSKGGDDAVNVLKAAMGATENTL